MESYSENKKFGDVFCRYIQTASGKIYITVDPQTVQIPDGYSDIDIVLTSQNNKPLYLQLKQYLEFEKREQIPNTTRSSIRIFKGRPMGNWVKQIESKYAERGKDISNVILILHLHLTNGYSIPQDAESGISKSAFKGAYLVSPEHNDVWQGGIKKSLGEFVAPLKKAFGGF